MINRPSWDERFMFEAISVATRHSCLKRGVGCAVSKNNRPLATGYNGAARDIKSCKELGYCYYEFLAQNEMKNNGGDKELIKERFKIYCQAVHAEVNARALCSPEELRGSTFYITNMPCPKCTQDVLITSQVAKVKVWKGYLENTALSMDEKRASERKLLEAGISLSFISLTSGRIMEIADYMANNVGERTDYKFKGGE
ncbi:MAG: hypothetical protein AAB696_01835 [Patescibacteria group bacterium]